MKRSTLFIEALEARVAPALLVNGANLLGGSGNPTSGETSTGANTVTLVKVLSGQALVFFNNGEITGISVGKGAKLDVTGDVNGDIVANLGPNGRLTDSDNNPVNGEDGGVLLGLGIKGVTTHPLGTQKGSVGRIISGAIIKNVNISGEVAGIYAGDGIFRNGEIARITTGGVDINSVQPGVQDAYTFSKAIAEVNGNAAIKNVTVTTARQLEIFAGNGADNDSGPGKAGSNIVNVTIQTTLATEGSKPVVFLRAGDGGKGATGGAGGSITSFNDQNSLAYVRLQTGVGGDATSGAAGAGGSLRSSTIVSSSPRYDMIMGDGGNGQSGGAGGGISALTFTNNVTGGKSLVAVGDLNNDGISDVVTLNTLTGESVVSLGTPFPDNPGEANFRVALQTLTRADGAVVQTPFLAAQGANPTSLVLSDLNGDGLLDFAVSYASTNSLGIYTNQNDGHFARARLDLTVSPTRLIAGDFTGQGHPDLAVVSSASTTTQQAGISSQIFVVGNDGLGNLTQAGTAAATFPGVATDAVSVSVTALSGANVFVGFTNGSISPVLFRAGAATVAQAINPFSINRVPVDSLDVSNSSGGFSLLAFSKNVNATDIANGNTTLTPEARVIVYGVNANGSTGGITSFMPLAETTKAHFLAGTSLVGTANPASVQAWRVGVLGQYEVLTTLASDGVPNDFASINVGGSLQIAAVGTATNRFFFANGDLSSPDGIGSFLPSEVPNQAQAINFTSGSGGRGDALLGGDGGTIKNLAYTQTLGGGVLEAGGAYNTVLTTGHGGDSNGEVGGKGGAIKKSNIQVTPAYLTYADDTSTTTFQTGAGGSGTSGGKGGSISKASVTAVYRQFDAFGVVPNAVAVRMLGGDGGRGTDGQGGAGGGIALNGLESLTGVSFVDGQAFNPSPGLLVRGGNGGDGVTGGNGGSLTNVGTQNAAVGGLNVNGNQLTSVQLTAGNGGNASDGNGGNGGNIVKADTAVAESRRSIIINNTNAFEAPVDGAITAAAGNGGLSRGGEGGIGGSVRSSSFASSSGDLIDGYGVLIRGGVGGDGDTAGGTGGGVNKVTVTGPADTLLYAAVIAAGNGGDALSAGVGGRGGNVQGLKQTKDINSAINVIQAGNGGLGAGDIGGVGGSVSNVRTVGFLGLPSTTNDPTGDRTIGAFFNPPAVFALGIPNAVAALFDSAQVPQGVFAGRGGAGAENGSVTNIVASQIAAIGASVRADGSFSVASSISNITANLIGYEVIRDGVFASSNGGTSPSTAVPIDGFLLGASVTEIKTVDNNRTGTFTFLG